MESGQLRQIVLTQRSEVENFRDIIMEIDIEFPTVATEAIGYSINKQPC